MNQSQYIARQVRSGFFGDNWCGVSLRSLVEGLDHQQANLRVNGSHSVAELVFHIGYYFQGVGEVLSGGSLSIKDKHSFEMAPITQESEWISLMDRTWSLAETFIGLVEQLPEERIDQIFVDEKYGDYYRNLSGLIEHLYYHLGQIALIKKVGGSQ